VGVDNVYEQANFIAQRIVALRDEGEHLGDIAVLYRSHYQSLELQMELSRRLIPYEIRSGVRFFEQAHIKDVLAYLKIVTNARDELSWKRTLKLYPKIGEKTAAEVWGRISEAVNPLEKFLRGLDVSGRGVAGSLKSLGEVLRLLDGAPVIDEAGTRELVIPGEEEERRLFYVAVTRAMQELYLVFPVMSRDRGGMDILMEPSRFVRELPGDAYEKWVIGSE